MAHKKGQGSSRNGRDSDGQRRGRNGPGTRPPQRNANTLKECGLQEYEAARKPEVLPVRRDKEVGTRAERRDTNSEQNGNDTDSPIGSRWHEPRKLQRHRVRVFRRSKTGRKFIEFGSVHGLVRLTQRKARLSWLSPPMPEPHRKI